MTAFPIKSNKKDSALSPLFGKAKYFAFLDAKGLEILQNDKNDGIEVVKWFNKKGVKNLIIKEMGSSPYKEIQKTDIKLFYGGDERLTINEVIKKIDEDSFELLSEKKLLNIIKKHESRHKNKEHSHNLEKRIVFPTNENMGYLSKVGAHFGKAKFYTIVTLKENNISDLEVIKNPGHTSGACANAITNIMHLSPNALIVRGIGTVPAKGFAKAGLDLYFDKTSLTIEDSLKLLNENKLEKIGSSGTCSIK